MRYPVWRRGLPRALLFRALLVHGFLLGSSRMWRRLRTTQALVLTVVALTAAASAAAADTAVSPFVRLFDTRAASPAPLGGEALAKRTGWAVVPAGTLDHALAGDAVFANDKLAIVLRRKGSGAELYARTPGGWSARGTMAPAGAGAALGPARAVENTPGAVMLEATFSAGRGRRAAGRFRLTAGVGVVEFRAGTGTSRVRIAGPIRHLVVGELFADDLAFSAKSLADDRTGIPAENQLLALLGSGDSLGVAVWRSVEQNADAMAAGTGATRTIRACEIDCGAKRPVWYGLLEAKGIWRVRAPAAAGAGNRLPGDFKPPFAAKWRAALVAGPARGLLVYPIDRSRATPLTVFCPIDVMRAALGVGVCQYVLAVEGLASDGQATPTQAARWLERVFGRGRDKRQADEVRQRLAEMTRHVRRVDERIASYVAVAGALAERCRREASSPNAARARLARDVRRLLATTVAARPVEPGRGASTERIAGQIAGQIGRRGAAGAVRALLAALPEIEAAQDRRLAVARQAFRRVRQRCRTIEADGSAPAVTLAREIRRQADRVLRTKPPAAPGEQGDRE